MPSRLTVVGFVSNPKLQIPDPNALPTSKSQYALTRSRSGVRNLAWAFAWNLAVGSGLGFGIWSLGFAEPSAQAETRRVAWNDVAAVQSRLALGAASFADYVARTHDENVRRVHEGDLDHLIFFLLQSRRLSATAPIEPALSAKALVEGMDGPARKAFLDDALAHGTRAPAEVTARIAALLRALEKPGSDVRLTYFRSLVETAFPDRTLRQQGLTREYFRAMRFVYEKEFVAQRSPRPSVPRRRHQRSPSCTGRAASAPIRPSKPAMS